jgi:polysaccharide biosynthesis/export protein
MIRCLVIALLAGCSSTEPLPAIGPMSDTSSPDYVIGPLDSLQVFVWRNPEVTTTVPVRPDGRISTPLIEDMQAAGKTPTQLARDIEHELGKYIVDPVATVIVTGFNGPFSQQVRVVGEAAKPQAIPYRENMTLLDVMIAVGGLTEFASGNRAVLIRGSGEQQKEYRVRLADLLKNGDVSANARILPGDVLMIPQSWF